MLTQATVKRDEWWLRIKCTSISKYTNLSLTHEGNETYCFTVTQRTVRVMGLNRISVGLNCVFSLLQCMRGWKYWTRFNSSIYGSDFKPIQPHAFKLHKYYISHLQLELLFTIPCITWHFMITFTAILSWSGAQSLPSMSLGLSHFPIQMYIIRNSVHTISSK